MWIYHNVDKEKKNKLESPFKQGYFVPSLVEIGQVGLEKIFF